MGLPVVATDIPGHTLLCGGLGACRLTAPEPEAIAAAIRSLLERTPAEAARAATDARAETARRRGLRAWAARLLDRYERALETRA